MITVFYTGTDGSTRSLRLNDTTQTHESSSSPTDHPVEDGADVTDHIKLDPDKVSFEVFVSNSLVAAEETNMDGAREVAVAVPLPKSGSATVVGFSSTFNRVGSVYDELRNMQAARVVCVVQTRLRRYADMCLTRLSTPVTNSEGVRFSLELRHIRMVSTETVSAPVPRNVRGNAAANAGQQALATIAAVQSATQAALASVPQQPQRSALRAALLGLGGG